MSDAGLHSGFQSFRQGSSRRNKRLRQRFCGCGAEITYQHGNRKHCDPCIIRIRGESNRKRSSEYDISNRAIVAYLALNTPRALEKIKAEIRKFRKLKGAVNTFDPSKITAD